MATKTAKQIQDDIYNLLRDSTLSSMISGAVYKRGFRPRDSRLEDAVVIFTVGFPGDVQSGVVTLNIYIPDIDPFGNGVMVEDGARTAELEAAAQEWVDSLTCAVSNYKFRLQSAITTDEESDIQQHFVVISLAYDLFEG